MQSGAFWEEKIEAELGILGGENRCNAFWEEKKEALLWVLGGENRGAVVDSERRK
jgi:hypothetical protein